VHLEQWAQVEESIRDKVEELKNVWKVEVEHSDELKGSLTSRSMPKTVAAVFDDLHGRLEEWVSAIEGRIYNIEQVIWSAVSLVDAATTASGNKPSRSRSSSICSGAMAGKIEVQPPLEAWNAETPVVHCLCVALRKLEGDVDIIRKSSDERNDEVNHMEASFRSEIDEIQLNIKECTQRLGHVELDMVHVKDEVKAQAVALEGVLQRDYQVQQTMPKVDGIQTRRHEAMTARELKPKGFNNGASVEIKAAHQPSVGASVEVRASHRKTPVARRVSRGAINTLRPATPVAFGCANSGHEGTVSIRVAAAPDPTMQQPPQQGQQTIQHPPPSQHHRQQMAPHTAWRWGMLGSAPVPAVSAASRQVSPSNSHTALPPQLQAERSPLAILKPAAFSKPASPSAALWAGRGVGPKAVARDRVSSPDLHQRA